MKRFLILFAIVLLLNGCHRHCCTTVSTTIFLKYQNSNGDDSLDPRTTNALKSEDMEVYVLRKGVRVQLLNYNLDYAKNFKIYGSSTEKYHMIFLFDIKKESFVKKKVTMFITYKDGSEDKLVGEFNENEGSSILLQNVWINDIAMGRPSYSPSTAFIIKK